MGKATGFLELDRQVESYREVDIRINDYDEIFSGTHNLDQLQEQGSRCCLLYTSPSPRDRSLSRMPSSA